MAPLQEEFFETDADIFLSFDAYEDQFSRRIFISKKSKYKDALKKILQRILEYSFSDFSLNKIELFNQYLFTLFIELDSDQIFLERIIIILFDKIKENYLPRKNISGIENVYIKYDLVTEYIIRLSKNILKYNYLASQSYLEILFYIQEYGIYANNSKSIKSSKIISYSKNLIKEGKSDILPEKFSDILDRNSKLYYSQISNKLEDISYFILDSKDPLEEINEEFYDISFKILKKSWGGAGLDIYKNLLDLNQLGGYIGRSEKSISGRMSLRNDLINIFNSCIYATRNNYEYFYITPGKNYLCLLKEIFTSLEYYSGEDAPGLFFLRNFNNLKSFEEGLDEDKIIHRYIKNYPIISKELPQENNTKLEIIKRKNNFINKTLEEIEKNIFILGDIVYSLKNTLNNEDQLKNYEGLGSLKYILELFNNIFPTKKQKYYLDNILDYAGFTGAIQNLSRIFSENPLNDLGEEYGFYIVDWINKIKNIFENLHSIIGITGYKKGQFIPNLNFEPSPRKIKDIKEYFLLRGYSQEDVNKISNIKNINDLIASFSNKMDSRDIESFSKGYDLLSGIYLIGGEKPIYAILDFLNSPDETGFKNIFSILNKSKDKYYKWNTFKYGELIGTLISIFGIDAKSLERLIPILSSQDQKITDALKFVGKLYSFSEDANLNLDTDHINKLIQYSSLGVFEDRLDLDCNDILEINSLELRKSLRLIDGAIGYASEDDISNLFDKNIGITPRELYMILNLKSNPGYSLLGGILSGMNGGNFTALVKNIYLSGLCYLFEPEIIQTKARKISQQIQEEPQFASLQDLFNQIEKIIILFRLTIDSYKNNLYLNTNDLSDKNISYEPILNSINKDINIYSKIFNYLSPGGSIFNRYKLNVSSLNDSISRESPILPPGLGNHPLILRTSQGVISPELGYYFTTKKITPRDLNFKTFTNNKKLIKLDYENNSNINGNLFLDEIPRYSSSYEEEDILIYNSRDQFTTRIDNSMAEKSNQIIISNLNEEFINNKKYDQTGKATFIKLNLEKINFEEEDPIERCKRMGTKDSICEETYSNYIGAECDNKFETINPTVEAYIDQSIETGIPISRPWGFLSEIDYPDKKFNFYKNPPNYWSNLNLNSYLHDSLGEPIDVINFFDDLFLDFSILDTIFYENQYIAKYGYPKNSFSCVEMSDLDKIMCHRLLKTFPLSKWKQIGNIHEISTRIPIKGFNYITHKSQGRIEFDYKIDNNQLFIYFDSIDNNFEYLKFNNTGIKAWLDIWFKDKNRIDFNIKEINLSNSEYLQYIRFDQTKGIEKLIANNCLNLSYLNLSNCENLERLELNSCTNLNSISFGKNTKLKILSLKNCDLSENSLENILSNFYPCESPAEYISLGKIKYESLLDLRGNFINWENRKISSKIRMLLANNFMVLWDNIPPEEIIPIQYYRSIII